MFRHLNGEHYVFYTNYIIVLLVNNIVFLVCHLRLDDKVNIAKVLLALDYCGIILIRGVNVRG